MPIIGKACHELRIRDENTTWRIVHHVDVDAAFSLG
jgi:phage-related protein